MSHKKSSGQIIFANLTIGLQLAITVFIFVYGGYRLDLYYNKTPLFLICGTIFGMGLGFYHMMKNLDIGNKKDSRNSEKDDEEKRIKWN